jgi:predicted nucleotidyltransferase
MTEQPPSAPLEDLFADAPLSDLLDALRTFSVAKAWVFGSVARGTAGPDSDLDLLVTFGRPTTLFQQFDLADRLGEISGREVHLMTSIDPIFEPYIRPTLIPLPL